MVGDRIFGAVAIIVAGGYILSATTIQTPLFPDPLGPKFFPILVAAGVILCSLVMILRPDPDAPWPGMAALSRIGVATALMAGYALSLGPMGFLLPTAVAAGVLSYMLNPRPAMAALTGLGLSIGLFLLFRYALRLETLQAVPRGWLA
jgi:putative tricarboxylic transport membrane protein